MKISFKKKLLSLMLSVILIIAVIPYGAFTVSAEEIRGVTNSDAKMYSAPGTGGTHSLRESVYMQTVPKNTTVTILNEERDADADLWYLVRLADSTQGYLYSGRVNKTILSYDADFEAILLNFPESYRSYLRILHGVYPNAKFVADILDVSFEDALNSEYGTSYKDNKKFVEFAYKNAAWRDPRAEIDHNWEIAEGNGRWTFASKEGIAYFLDPRNYLDSEQVFAFLQQSYDSSETKDRLRTVVAGTFLDNGYGGNTDAYLDDILAVANVTGVSSYFIAATIIIEQGVNGTSSLISGTYSGYEGYYNFFNIGASGSTNEKIVASGLAKAVERGWNTRYLSIKGGAETLKNGYIEKNQDTYYYMDYNVVNKNWYHQYATSLYDASIKAKRLSKSYSGNSNATFTFKIPVFSSIPDSVSPDPSIISSYYLFDDEFHWRENTSTHDKLNISNHIFDNACDSTCDICGYVRNSAHVYTDSCDTTCNTCGYVRTAPHNYIDGKCTLCDKYDSNVIASGVFENGAKWYVNSSTNALYIYGNGETDKYKTSASAPWYANRSTITKVYVESGITKIGNYSFDCLTNLTSIHFDSKDMTFGYYVFPQGVDFSIFAKTGGNLETYSNINNILFNKYRNKTTPTKPTVLTNDNFTVTLTDGSAYEYSLDGVNFTSNNVFTNLEPNKTYNFYKRAKETDEYSCSYVSSASKVMFISAPVIKLVGATKAEIKTISGFEYSLDKTVWQSTSLFDRLVPEEEYTLYVRLKNSSGVTVVNLAQSGVNFTTGEFDSISDIPLTAQRMTFLINSLLNATNEMASDVNGDKKIDILDLVALKKQIASAK